MRITASAQDGSGVSDTFEIQIVEKPVDPPVDPEKPGEQEPPVDPEGPADPDDGSIPDTGDALGRSLFTVIAVTLAAAGAASMLWIQKRRRGIE